MTGLTSLRWSSRRQTKTNNKQQSKQGENQRQAVPVAAVSSYWQHKNNSNLACRQGKKEGKKMRPGGYAGYIEARGVNPGPIARVTRSSWAPPDMNTREHAVVSISRVFFVFFAFIVPTERVNTTALGVLKLSLSHVDDSPTRLRSGTGMLFSFLLFFPFGYFLIICTSPRNRCRKSHEGSGTTSPALLTK